MALRNMINGGEFKHVGTSPNTGTGMNNLSDEVYMEINGGTFAGDLYLIGNVGTNTTGYTPAYSGKAALKITGAHFQVSLKPIKQPHKNSQAEQS